MDAGLNRRGGPGSRRRPRSYHRCRFCAHARGPRASAAPTGSPAAAQPVAVPPVGAAGDEGAMAQPAATAAIAISVHGCANNKAATMEVTEVTMSKVTNMGAAMVAPADGSDHVGRGLA